LEPHGWQWQNHVRHVLRRNLQRVAKAIARSSFKDWCAEVTKARDEVSEAALAHGYVAGPCVLYR